MGISDGRARKETMTVMDIPISDLVPYDRNPRKNDGAVAPVVASIREFGFKVPIVIDRRRLH